MQIACIVEGEGEVEAVPLLIQRIAAEAFQNIFVSVVRPPIRIPRSKLVKPDELERAVELAARRAGPDGALLVIIDSDDDCPAQLGPALLQRARNARGDYPIGVVLAKGEYEAWFIAAALSLRGKRGLSQEMTPPPHPEAVRDAKGWLREWMPQGRKYRETLDQPALTSVFDLQSARNCRSFEKCYREVVKIIRLVHDNANAAD